MGLHFGIMVSYDHTIHFSGLWNEQLMGRIPLDIILGCLGGRGNINQATTFI